MTNYTHYLNTLHGRCVAGLAMLDDIDPRAIDSVSREMMVRAITRRLSAGQRLTLVRDDLLPLHEAEEVSQALRLAEIALRDLADLRASIMRDLRFRAEPHRIRAARAA